MLVRLRGEGRRGLGKLLKLHPKQFGAPEEIRTPDPQIRSLKRLAGHKSSFAIRTYPDLLKNALLTTT